MNDLWKQHEYIVASFQLIGFYIFSLFRFQPNGPSIFSQSFAGRVLDELSPEGSLYDAGYIYGQEKLPPPHHHVTKRGGSMGYGGVYSPGSDGKYRATSDSNDYR